MENIRTQISNNTVQDYVELTKQCIRVLRYKKPEQQIYQDVIRDFKQKIGGLKGLEMEQYISIILKEFPEDLGTIVQFFPAIDLLIKTINRNIAKNISSTVH